MTGCGGAEPHLNVIATKETLRVELTNLELRVWGYKRLSIFDLVYCI
jgi:hypothetical protein